MQVPERSYMYTTVNAGLYARLSVEDENNPISESIQTQKAMLTDYCREKGYRIVDYYVDEAVIIGLKTLRLIKCQKHGAF